MAQLTKTRLLMHSSVFVFLVGYMIYAQVSLKQGLFIFGVFVFYELLFLTSNIIYNMKPRTKKLKLEGKRVVITGGSSGIGYSLAKQFVKEGCSKLVLIARNEDRLKKCVDELKNSDDKEKDQIISYLALDLSKDGDTVADKIGRVGNVDILVNCAGFSVPGEFQNLQLDIFEKMMRVNYLASVYATHAVVQNMIKQKSGQIVFLSSVAGQLGVYGFSAYSPSKFALRGFAEVLYHELRPYNIGVSLVFPPDTDTPGYESENKSKPKLCQLISEQTGLWKAEDVAKSIMDGIANRKFMIGMGSDGYFMNALTIGAAPSSSLLDFWIQSLLMPILRIYMLFLQNFWTNMITDELVDDE